jgi:uncharacterized protein YgiB involved in biofilm formation
MKKTSTSLSLVLMGTLTAGLGGCGSSEKITEEFKAYSSIDECVKEQIFTPAECRDMAIEAVRQNPQFADQAECEKRFGEGNCQTVAGGDQQGERRSSWMPLMAGYMIGRYMGGGPMQGSQPLYKAPEQPQQGQQGARSSGGFTRAFRTVGGETVQTDAKGKVTNTTPAMRQGFAKSAKPMTLRSGATKSRGGFFGGSGSS